MTGSKLTLTARSVEGTPDLLSFGGPWSIFRWFYAGEWAAVPGGNEVTWTILNDLRVRAILGFDGGENVFQPGYLDTFRCPGSITGE